MQTSISIFENELINKLQFKASSKVSSDALLFKTFKFFDLYNNGYLNNADFFRAIAKCGVIVQSHLMKQIFNHYSQHSEDKIYYKEFIDRVLFKETSENKSTVSHNNDINENKSQLMSQQKSSSSPMGKLKVQEITHNAETFDEILDLIRHQIRKDGISGLLSFSNNLKASDTQKTHKINSHRLKSIIGFLSTEQVKTLIENFNPSPNGQINYAELIYSLKGDISEDRHSIIQQTFQLLDQNKAGEIQINRLISLYKPKNKGEFQNLLSCYCQFQAINDGFFTDQDFVDFFEFLSFHFTTNQSFLQYITKAYYDREDAKSSHSNRSRPRQFDRESNKDSNKQVKYEHKKEEEQIKETGKAFKKDKLSSHEDLSQHNEEIKSVSRHSRQSKNTQSSHVKEVQLIILRIKKRLASKGTKGFLLFERALKNADSDLDGLINIDQFKKVVKEQRIDITNTQSNIIFDVFDDQHIGLIDFGSFIYTVKGQTSQERKLLINRIWNRVSKNGHTTSFSIVKQMMNLRGHPDIQNGRRYEEDIIKQVQDTILLIQDLNGGKRSQQIVKDDFVEYLQNLSMTTAEDQLFEMIAKNFWKIPSQNNIEDEYAGSRKMFDTSKKSYLMDHHRYAVNGGSSTQNAPYGTFSQPTNYLTEHRKL